MKLARSACAAFALVLAAATSGASAADAYPTRVVTIVNPFAAGGSLDILLRLMAERMAETLGQSVIVENRPGAGSTIGTAVVARARPDGYTVLATATNIVTAPALGAPVQFDWKKDFAPVTLLGTIAQFVAVPQDSPAKTLQDFVALAKAKPGSYSIGSLGPGSSGNVNGKRLEQAAQIQLVDIPYKGMSETMTALASGQIQVAYGNVPDVLMFQRGGRVRPIAIAMPARSELAPNVPTMTEAGFPTAAAPPWYGVLVPAGTPPEIVAKLQESFAAAMKHPPIAARIREMAITPIASTPDEFRQHLEAEYAMYSKLGKEMGISLK